MTDGVVAPLRIPVPAAIERAWRALPLLGRAFVALTVVDVLGRAIGVLGSLNIEPSSPLTFVTAFLPHDALILLPAVILARRPDAGSATPLILRGATIVALVELLAVPLGSLPVERPSANPLLSWTVLSIVGTLLTAIGWLAIVIGLARMRPPLPGRAIVGLSNLVAAVIGIGAIASLFATLTAPPIDLGEGSWSTMALLASAMLSVQTLVWAFLGRTIVLGSIDTRRSAVATSLATVAIVLSGIDWLLLLVTSLLVAIQNAFGLSLGAPAGVVGLGWVGGGMVQTALVVAFGLGLADSSVSTPGRSADLASGPNAAPGHEAAPEPEPEPAREPVSWPEPGRDVPVYRYPPADGPHDTSKES